MPDEQRQKDESIAELEARLMQAERMHEELSNQMDALIQQNEEMKAILVDGFKSMVDAINGLKDAVAIPEISGEPLEEEEMPGVEETEIPETVNP